MPASHPPAPACVPQDTHLSREMDAKVLVSRDERWQHQAVQAVSLVDRTSQDCGNYYSMLSGPRAVVLRACSCLDPGRKVVLQLLFCSLPFLHIPADCGNHAADFVGIDMFLACIRINV